jgi:hypothetical protein
MAHYAKVIDGIVTEVIVAEPDYIQSIENLDSSNWVQTSYNTLGGKHLLGGVPLRKNYAGIGFVYDKSMDAFIPPKPFNSWILDEETCLWNPPVKAPDDGNFYEWDELTQSWDLAAIPKGEVDANW